MVKLKSGTVTGMLVSRARPWKIGVLGGFLMGTGYAVSYFATNTYFLIVSVGIISGFGSSCLMATAMTVLLSAFQGRSRILALAFGSVGSGIGGIASPYLLVVLEAEYGLPGAFLMSGGILLNTIPLSCSLTLLIDNDVFDNKKVSGDTELSQQKPRSQTCFEIVSTLFTNKHYVLGPVCVSIGVSILTSLNIFIVDVFISRGWARNNGVFALFLMNFIATVGRLVNGLFKQCPHTSVFNIPFLACVTGGISIMLFHTVTTLLPITLLTGVIGFTFGILISSIYITAAKVVGDKLFPVGQGVASTVGGVLGVCIPPIIGYTKDRTGSYKEPFFVSGLVLLFCALLVFIVWIMRICSKDADVMKNDTELQNEIIVHSSIETSDYEGCRL
ncbi:hypothetical protein ScPMuIL_008167 [Solemya velum]